MAGREHPQGAAGGRHRTETTEELPVTSLKDHAVIVGCGRVGSLVAEAMMT